MIVLQTIIPVFSWPGALKAQALVPTVSDVASQSTVRRFQDWELGCLDAPSSATGTACRVSQRLAAPGSTDPVFAATLLYNKTAGVNAPVMVLSTPLGGYLAPGMELRIDKGPPLRVVYETCTAGGCHGGFVLN
jgi:invasion protein IalB